MTLRKLAPLTLTLFFAFSAIAADQTADDAFNSNYRDLEEIPYPVLIAELDEQIEWLILVSAAAPPDLRHKIAAIKIAIFQALKKELCAASDSEVPPQIDRRTAAARNLVAALSPKRINAHDRGAIAATLVRIIELEPDRYCLHV